MTLEELLRDGTTTLLDNGYIHGQKEVEAILAHFTGQDSAWILSHGEETIDEELIEKVSQAVADRVQGKPLAYILGTQQFFGWQFISDERGLIPRPETEQLVEKLIHLIRQHHLEDGHFLEVGTGSGVISITLKKYFPGATITATDVSAEALELAEDNAKRLKVDVDFLESDLFAAVPQEKFDLIVANLPYVPSGKLAFVADQILDWEPLVAIDAGEDGLKYIQPLIEQAEQFLKPGGLMALEMWHTHGPDITDLAKKFLPNHEVIIEKDLAGYDRFALLIPLN